MAHRSSADTYYLNTAGTSDWDSSYDFSSTWQDTTINAPSDLPTNGSTVNILQTGTNGVGNATVNMNYTYSGTGLTTLFVDSGNLISQTASSSMMIAGDEYIGCVSGAAGGQYNQTAGTNNISDALYVGYANGARGTYTVSGGSLKVGSGLIYVGYAGSGTFTLNTFFNMESFGELFVGYSNSAHGTFNLNDSSFVRTALQTVGYQGTGVVNQTGGYNETTVDCVLGDSPGSTGIYNLSGGQLQVDFNGGLIVGGNSAGGGLGMLFISGTATCEAVSGGVIYGTTSGTNASGIYMTGGWLGMQYLVNGGQLSIQGGTASVQRTFGSGPYTYFTPGLLSGTGATTVGGGSATAQLTVGNFAQNTINIGSNGYVAVASNTNTTQVTNAATALTITGSGQLDLANTNLITSTSPSLVRQYLINGYNSGAWNGTGGISSISAAASTNHTMALGYTGGNGSVGAGLGLATNQTLVKYTIYGDANLDGVVNGGDLNIVVRNYLSSNAATWDTGDSNYDNKTDISDLDTVMSNYGRTASATIRLAAAHTLGGTVSPADVPAPGNGALELIVDYGTGDVRVEGNNADIASLQVTSASGAILIANWQDLNSQGNSSWSDTVKQSTAIGQYDSQFVNTDDYALINGITDYGNIYNINDAQDLVFEYGAVDANGTTVDTESGPVFYVPEPTTLGLLGITALLRRRRRRQP